MVRSLITFVLLSLSSDVHAEPHQTIQGCVQKAMDAPIEKFFYTVFYEAADQLELQIPEVTSIANLIVKLKDPAFEKLGELLPDLKLAYAIMAESTSTEEFVASKHLFEKIVDFKVDEQASKFKQALHPFFESPAILESVTRKLINKPVTELMSLYFEEVEKHISCCSNEAPGKSSAASITSTHSLSQ